MELDTKLVLDMQQSGGESENIDGSGGTVYTKPVKVGKLHGDNSGVSGGTPTEIGFNIHNVTATLAGNWQAVNALEDADFAEASTKWADIDGGNLAQWPSGGCSVIKAPYTHIRAKVSAGKCNIALSSSASIYQVG